MHYYSHHIGDFVRATSRLNNDQCMAYLRMLWLYYESETPLENDADAIAFKIGATASDVHQILKHFFFLHEGMWHQPRCDEEILKYREKSKKATDAANARWSNANAMRTHSECNADEPLFDANHKPITSKPSKQLPPDGGTDLKADLFSLAKTVGIKPSMVGKAIKDIGEVEAYAALNQSNGTDNPTNAFAAGIRNRKAKIQKAEESARPVLNDPRRLSL